MNDKVEKKIDTDTLLANIKNKATPEPTPAVEAPVIPKAAPAVVVPEPAEMYQQYTSARTSTCLITDTGKRVNFTNYQYYTKDQEIIQYLDRQMKYGLQGFTKGKVLSAEDLNPEAAKKREIIEEFKASQEGREFGDTKSKEERNTALSSDKVAR